MRIILLITACLLTAAPGQAQDQQFADLGTLELESGEKLLDCRIGYRTFGTLAGSRDNAILIPTWYGGAS